MSSSPSRSLPSTPSLLTASPSASSHTPLSFRLSCETKLPLFRYTSPCSKWMRCASPASARSSPLSSRSPSFAPGVSSLSSPSSFDSRRAAVLGVLEEKLCRLGQGAPNAFLHVHLRMDCPRGSTCTHYGSRHTSKYDHPGRAAPAQREAQPVQPSASCLETPVQAAHAHAIVIADAHTPTSKSVQMTRAQAGLYYTGTEPPATTRTTSTLSPCPSALTPQTIATSFSSPYAPATVRTGIVRENMEYCDPAAPALPLARQASLSPVTSSEPASPQQPSTPASLSSLSPSTRRMLQFLSAEQLTHLVRGTLSLPPCSLTPLQDC